MIAGLASGQDRITIDISGRGDVTLHLQGLPLDAQRETAEKGIAIAKTIQRFLRQLNSRIKGIVAQSKLSPEAQQAPAAG